MSSEQDLEPDLAWDLEYFYDFPAPPAAEGPPPVLHRPPLAADNERVTHMHSHTRMHTRTPAHTIDFNTPRLSSFGKKIQVHNFINILLANVSVNIRHFSEFLEAFLSGTAKIQKKELESGDIRKKANAF